jgi:tetratricopeptide (TPR) repeat protein
MPTTGLPRRLLILGLDGLDGSLLHPAIDAGLLPAFGSLVARGAVGDLATGDVVEPVVAWTTLLTGHRADRHRVLDGHAFDPTIGDLRPVGSVARQVHALWNLAHREGLASVCVGWPASDPADRIAGAFVSERFFELAAPIDAPWPVRPGSVHPEGLETSLAGLRVHPDEFGAEELVPFVPSVAKIDPTRDSRPALLMEAIADTVSRHAVATALLEREPWSLAAIRYPLLDRLGRWFLRFRPPRLEGVDERDVERFGGVMDAALRLLDGMLARLVQLAGEETTVIVASPFGLRCGSDRPAAPGPPRAERPERWRPDRGSIVIAGSRIAADRLLHGASALDVVPTALAMLRLPVGADMPGRVLAEGFEQGAFASSKAEPVESWESLEGEFGRGDAGAESTTDPDADAAWRQLIDLGYVEDPAFVERTGRNQRAREEFNLANTHIRARRWSEAIPPLERIVAVRATETGCLLLLATCHLAVGDAAAVRSCAERARLDDKTSPALVELLLAGAAHLEGRPRAEILEHVRAADEAGGPEVADRLAYAYLALRRFEDAARVIEAADLSTREASPMRLLVRSLIELARGDAEASAATALEAIGRCYHWPEAHATLGIALAGMGRPAEARLALERSIEQRPTARAHLALASLLERTAWDVETARRHRTLAAAIETPTDATTRARSNEHPTTRVDSP